MTHEEILKAAEKNHFVNFCGIKLFRDEDGNYYSTVSVEDHHLNPYQIVHGGLMYTMADTTAGSNARRFGDHPVTLNSDFHYFGNVPSGTLTAVAEIVRTGRTVLVIRVKVFADGGNCLAEGVFTYFNRAR